MKITRARVAIPDNHDDQSLPNKHRTVFSRRALLQGSAAGAAAGLIVGCSSPDSNGQASAEIPDWSYENIPALHGRRANVTGANGYPQEDRSGLGYHQALGLARAGAEVTIASRDRERGEEAVRRMRAEVAGAIVRFEQLDLANLESVTDFAARMRASGNMLDLLINNAGVMARLHREVSVDGFERVFATNALGPFALTAQLLPLLRNGSAPRIVWMASLRGHTGEINFDDLQHERAYDHPATYNATKLANLLLAIECERRSKASGWGAASIAAHPGVARTNIVLDGPGPDSAEGWRFRNIRPMWQDPAQGALPVLYERFARRGAGARQRPGSTIGGDLVDHFGAIERGFVRLAAEPATRGGLRGASASQRHRQRDRPLVLWR